MGAISQDVFSIGCDGTLSYNGNSKFYGCDAQDKDGNNIYSSVMETQIGCEDLTLVADFCIPDCPGFRPPYTPVPIPSALIPPIIPPEYTMRPRPAPQLPNSKSCPRALSGDFQYPHLIVQVSSKKPERLYGPSTRGRITPADLASIFNFDIPLSARGKTCSLIFLFPYASELQSASFSLVGDTKVGFTKLSGLANERTTYSSMPGVVATLGSPTLRPGSSLVITSFDCPVGQGLAFMLESGSTDFWWDEDWRTPP